VFAKLSIMMMVHYLGDVIALMVFLAKNVILSPSVLLILVAVRTPAMTLLLVPTRLLSVLKLPWKMNLVSNVNVLLV